MLATSDTTLASAQGGANWFKPMKFVAKEGGNILKMAIESGPNGRKVTQYVRGVEELDRTKQIARIAGTAVGTVGVGGGIIYAAKHGQGGEAQTRSIEQLTGLA